MSDKSDIFCDNTDSDPDYIPDSDPGNKTNSSSRLGRIFENIRNRSRNRKRVHSNEVQQPNNVVIEESSESALSDVEVSPNPEPNKGRKRKKNLNNWKRMKENKKRLFGKEYTSRSGHTVAAKVFNDRV